MSTDWRLQLLCTNELGQVQRDRREAAAESRRSGLREVSMATLLSHQHQQSANQLLYANAPITFANQQVNHHHAGHPQPSAAGGHFCKDCEVMFESSTSLEVHLSYHKENLLTRWANQDALDKSSNSSTSTSGSNYVSYPFPILHQSRIWQLLAKFKLL